MRKLLAMIIGSAVLTTLAGCGAAQASTAAPVGTGPGASTAVAALTVTGASSPGTFASGSAVPSSVPAQYRATYAELQSNLTDLSNQMGAGSSTPGAPAGGTVVAGALNLADGNRGTSLLEPSTLPEVIETVNHLHQLGATGAMLEIGYPMLLPSFPNSAAYLSFYEKVAAAVAADSMALSVELNPIFTDPQVSSLHPDYHGLTVATYAAQQQEEAQIVIDYLHPTYLTVLDEPSTFSHNLGLPLDTPPADVSLLDAELSGLQRRGTLIGAGVGTWESPAIEKAIADETPVDYLSVHLYPTGPAQLANLATITEIAAGAHKPLVMDETWLSKSNPDSPPGIGNPDIEGKVKNWSFWQPLDSQFLTTVVTYARSHGFSLVSPFSTDLFFGYVKWTPALQGESKGQVNSAAAAVQLPNIVTGRFDLTGLAYGASARS